MVFRNLSRLYIGLLIVFVVLFSYLINLDITFLLFLSILVTYDFFYMKITNNFFLIFMFLVSFLSILFFSSEIFQYLFAIQIILLLLVLFINKFKKELFICSLYTFCLILFYIVKLDRNLFYLIFFISFFNDTIAYISGRFVGGPRILPKISPNKTWSGTSVSFLLSTLILILMNFNEF